MKKTLFLTTILLALAWSGDAGAQLVTYDFEGDMVSPSFIDGAISATTFGRNEGNAFGFSTGDGGGRAISGSGWEAGTGEYWEFTVMAGAGVTLDLASLSFDSRSTGSGPVSWAVAINGLPAGTGTIDNDSSFHPIFTPLGSFSGLSSALVRISGSGASASGGTWRLDNVVLDGLALTPVPEPSTWVLLAGGSVFLASRLRRRK